MSGEFSENFLGTRGEPWSRGSCDSPRGCSVNGRPQRVHGLVHRRLSSAVTRRMVEGARGVSAGADSGGSSDIRPRGLRGRVATQRLRRVARPQEGKVRTGRLTTLPDLMQEVQALTRFGTPPTSARTRWMLGSQRRLVRRCEWLMFIPNDGFLPQMSHTAAMTRQTLPRDS
jgi:hypothetical protein